MRVVVQYAVAPEDLPGAAQFRRWAQVAVAPRLKAPDGELVVRLVDEAEGAALNQTYRGKAGPTNVLAFAHTLPAGVPCALLGDIIICVPVVQQEAAQQNKLVLHHFAHLVVHGVLHLQGFDHQSDVEAAEMATHEIRILNQLGLPDPYA